MTKKQIECKGNIEDKEKESTDNKLEDTKYLKKILLKNKIKIRNNRDIKIFDTYDQKNKKILKVIKQNFMNKNKAKNNLINENLKNINQKNELFFRKRKLNSLSNKMNAFSHHLNCISNKLSSYLENTKDGFNQDINNIFN